VSSKLRVALPILVALGACSKNDRRADPGEERDVSADHPDVVAELSKKRGPVVLSGLKNDLRKRDPDFSERKFGYGGFLQFCKAAATRGLIELDWSDELGDYEVVVR
jgi:hypothetical protein